MSNPAAIEQRSAQPPRRVRTARGAYRIMGWLWLGGVVVQVYFAGLGLLVDPVHLGLHTAWAHVIELLPIAMLVAAFIGRMPRRMKLWTALLFVLFILQYTFIYSSLEIGPIASRALHPTNALALFGLGIYLVYESRRLTSDDEQAHAS